MNLKDVIDPEYGLQQDEWSLTKPTFGEHGQLQVVGWSGKNESNAKLYIVKCNDCSQDSELFGDGLFRSLKGNLIKGQIPCGCAKMPKWTKEQWNIRATRKALELGYVFIDFNGAWKGHKTKITLSCSKHGKWSTNSLHMLIKGRGCPECMVDVAREVNLKPDEDMITSFFASGAFHPNTKFWRSNRKSRDGRTPYWNVYCPECNNEGESISGHLQKGSRPCLCSKARQQQAYINFVKDNDSPIAIKFGIANVASTRVKQQNRTSIYTIENHIVYEFPTKQECLKAELECKQELQCGVVSKEEMEDGWTETTYLSNLNKIIEIYKKHNGVIYES